MSEYNEVPPDWCDEHADARTVCGCSTPAPAEVVVRLDRVQPERVSWLWPGRIPLGKMTVLDGDPGVGKSTLSLDLAARVTRGRAWPDAEPCPRGAVVLLSAEDGLADTIRPRLDAAGADPSRVHALTAITVTTTDEAGQASTHTRPPHLGDLDRVERVIRDAGALLLVVDVLMAYLPSGVDSHRDQDVRGVLHRLAAMAERAGCAVLLLRHLNKAAGGSPLYRGGGSIGIVGAARAGFVAARDPDDDGLVVLAPTKNNLAAPPASLGYRLVTTEHGAARVDWTGVVDRQAGDLLRGPDHDDDREERDALTEFIRELVAAGPVPSKDAEKRIREAFGTVPKATVYRARKRAGVTTRKAGMSGGWAWSSAEGFTEDSEGSGSPRAETYGTFVEPSQPTEPDPATPLHACAGAACRVPGCPEGGAA